MSIIPFALCVGIGSAVISVIAAVLHPAQPDSMLLSVSFDVLWCILLFVMSGRVR